MVQVLRGNIVVLQADDVRCQSSAEISGNPPTEDATELTGRQAGQLFEAPSSSWRKESGGGSLTDLAISAVAYGGSVGAVQQAMTGVCVVAQKSIDVRRVAIERAKPKDIPRLVGDEIDKLGINAKGITSEQKFQALMATLGQRENRSKRLFQLAFVVAVLAAVVIIVVVVSRPTPASQDRQRQLRVAPKTSISRVAHE